MSQTPPPKRSNLSLTIAAVALCLFLAVLAIRFEMLRTHNDFLMKLVQLESASFAEYEAEFGKAMYNIHPGEWQNPSFMELLEGKLTEGQTAHFFPAKTISHKYLIVVTNADGSVAWRTWLQM